MAADESEKAASHGWMPDEVKALKPSLRRNQRQAMPKSGVAAAFERNSQQSNGNGFPRR